MAGEHRLDDCLTAREGHLWIEGCDTVALAERFGTPLFVLSEDQLRRNVRAFQSAFQAGWQDGPVRILHGLADETVPWQHGLRAAEALASKDVTITLVKGGDHRLSGPEDLARLTAALDEIVARTAG